MSKKKTEDKEKKVKVKEIANSWLAGLDYQGKKIGFFRKFFLRNKLLDASEWSFTHRATYGGSIEVLNQNRKLAHYSMIDYRPSQITETIRAMMGAGIDIHNIEEVYNRSELQEFKTVMISQDGTRSELILKRSKDTLDKTVIGKKKPIEVTFDCPIDAYVVYGQKGHPTRLLRICRAKANEGKVCWIYTEVFPMPRKNILEQFDYYQKTGMQFFRVFLVMQYLWMQKDRKAFFVVAGERQGSEFKADPRDPYKHFKRVKVPIYDYRLGDLSTLKAEPRDVKDWHTTIRGFAMRGWPKEEDYVLEVPGVMEDIELQEVNA